MLVYGSRLLTALTSLFLTASAAFWMGGCTSDPADIVGSGLVDTELTEVLVNLLAQDVANYGPIYVDEPALPLHNQQVLYLGNQNGVSSRMVMNYDFADIFSNAYPDTLFTAERIKSVKLSLTKLSHYSGTEGGTGDNGGQPLDLYYTVQQLTAPFDSTLYVGYPNAAPPYGGPALNSDFLIPIQDDEPFLRMYEEDFLEWLAARQTMGLIISQGAGSDPGLVGFAARDLVRYSELDDVRVGTVVAPNLVVEFEDSTIPSFLLAPYSDTSTFETVPPAPVDPTDGFVVRTCLRSYPTLDFDFSTLPDNVLINRAVLRLTNHTELSFGNSEALVVAEFAEATIIAAPLTMTPPELNLASYLITGQVSLDPTQVRHLAFDVTTLVQRIVNNVYPDQRGLILAAAEDAFATYDLSLVDPDFYFTEFRFMGTGAPDSLRPRIQIAYSYYDEPLGGGR